MNNEKELKEELKKGYSEVLTFMEMQEKYTVESFCMGMVIVKRKSDDQKGTMDFTHMPRFYYNFLPID